MGSFYSLAKDVVKILLRFAGEKQKYNTKLQSFLKKRKIVRLQNTFDSIYLFSLIHYSEFCNPKELIALFGNQEIIDAFQNSLYQSNSENYFYTQCDHILHTCKDDSFLALKKNFETSRLNGEIKAFKEIFTKQTHQAKTPVEIDVDGKLDAIKRAVESPSGGKVEERIDQGKLLEELNAASQSLSSWPFTVGANQTWLERTEFNQIKEKLASKEPATLLLLGEPGSGKSALLSNLTNSLIDQGRPVLGIKADMLPKDIAELSQLQSYLNLTYPMNIIFKQVRIPVLIID